jgi:hypothetical protein
MKLKTPKNGQEAPKRLQREVTSHQLKGMLASLFFGVGLKVFSEFS